MDSEGKLRAKLAKLNELFRRAGSPGEQAAAGAAMDRLQGRLGKSDWDADRDPEVELQFSLSDSWSVKLFVAVCRKHGVRTFRYARQRRTTVMVRTRENQFNRTVWTEFNMLHSELDSYFLDFTDHLIERALRPNRGDKGRDRKFSK